MKVVKRLISFTLSGVIMMGMFAFGTAAKADETALDEVNLALGKTVTAATGVNPKFPECVEKNMTDGDYSTYWEGVYSSGASSDTLLVDLEEIKTVGRLKVYWGSGYPKTIRLSVSPDGQTYSGSSYSYSGDGTELELEEPADCRYIKLEISNISAGNIEGFSVYELEVYAPRADVRVKSVSASSEYSIGARRAGVSQLDLGDEYETDRVEVIWDAQSYDGYYLQGSLDADTWEDIDYTLGGEPRHTFRFSHRRLRYVRIVSEEGRETAIEPSAIEVYCDSNYALYSTVSSDANVNDDNKRMNNVNDGDFSTRMETGSRDTAYVCYDLGARIDVTRINLDFWADLPGAVRVSVSDDASDWTETTAFTFTDDEISAAKNTIQHSIVDRTISDTEGRYIKFDLSHVQGKNGGPGKDYFCMWEFEVYTDKNFADGKAVTSAVTDIDGKTHKAESAILDDGGYWMSGCSDDESITLELEESEPVYKIAIDWAGAYGVDYDIELSEDGESYRKVFKATERTGGSETIEFAPRMAKFVRIKGVKRGSELGYAISGIRLWKDTRAAAEMTVSLLDRVAELCREESARYETDELLSAWISSQDNQGGWYHDKDDNPYYIDMSPELDAIVSDWPNMYEHIYRVKEILNAYLDPDSAYYGCGEALDAVNAGIEYWFEVRKPYQTSNWWHDDLGIQQKWREVALTGQFVIKEKNLNYITGKKASGGVAGSLLSYVEDRHTGTNKVWFAENTIYKGLLTQDAVKCMRGVSAINSTIEKNDLSDLTKRDGMMYDDSFTQHGSLLYSNGYGRSFYLMVPKWLYRFIGTPSSFPNSTCDMVADMYINGNAWMERYDIIDPISMGREFIRVGYDSDYSANAYLGMLRYLKAASPSRAEAIDKIIANIKRESDNPGFTGNKMFWTTDYMTHLRDSYFASVKMQSKGVKGSESTNSENVLGGFLSMGMTTIMKDGYEYVDERDTNHKRYVYPVWDWSLLPGVTAPRIECTTNYGTDMNNTFVGGVTDGNYGAAAMDAYKAYELNSGSYKGVCTLAAKKSYFMFDNELVALGTGIKSNSLYDITTALNQSLLNGDVYVNGNKIAKTAGSDVDARDGNTAEHETNYKPELDRGYIVDDAVTMSGVSRVWHDDIGYVFPNAAEVQVKNGAQTGSWERITVDKSLPQGAVTDDIFSMRINHGRRPGNDGNAEAEYAYIILPSATREETDLYNFGDHIEIISNTKDMQAVKQKDIGVTGVIFYTAGSVEVAGNTLGVDNPCMLLARETADGIEVSVSNADETNRVETVTVDYSNSSGKESAVFKLPQDNAHLGQSVTMSIPNPDSSSASLEIKDFAIKSEDGRVITGFANGSKVRVAATLANEFDASKPAAVTAALYEREKDENGGFKYTFAGCSTDAAIIEADTGEAELCAEIEIPDDDKLYVVKGMLWNSLNGMKPMRDAVVANTLSEGLERVSGIEIERDIDKNTLTWSAPYLAADSYNIYRLDENGAEYLLGSAAETEFTDTDVRTTDYLTVEDIADGKSVPTYDYVIRAVINGSESSESAEQSVRAIETARIEFNGESGEMKDIKTWDSDSNEQVTVTVNYPDIKSHGITLLGIEPRHDGCDPVAGMSFSHITDGLGSLRVVGNKTASIDGYMNNHQIDFGVDDGFVADDDRNLIVYITYYNDYNDAPHMDGGLPRRSIKLRAATTGGNKQVGDVERFNTKEWITAAIEISDAKFNEIIGNRNSVRPYADLRIEKAGAELMIHSIEIRNLDREARSMLK